MRVEAETARVDRDKRVGEVDERPYLCRTAGIDAKLFSVVRTLTLNANERDRSRVILLTKRGCE